MDEKRQTNPNYESNWLLYAIISQIFALIMGAIHEHSSIAIGQMNKINAHYNTLTNTQAQAQAHDG